MQGGRAPRSPSVRGDAPGPGVLASASIPPQKPLVSWCFFSEFQPPPGHQVLGCASDEPLASQQLPHGTSGPGTGQGGYLQQIFFLEIRGFGGDKLCKT